MLSTHHSLSLTQVFDDLMALKREEATGQLIVTSPQESWTFYIQDGQLLYGTGGQHSVKRWQRHLSHTSPGLTLRVLQTLVEEVKREPITLSWEYQFINRLLAHACLSQPQVKQVIYDGLAEILADILQTDRITRQFVPGESLLEPVTLIDPVDLARQEQARWQQWSAAPLKTYSFNGAPVIAHPQELQARTSPKVYETLVQLLNGEHTLRDLGMKMQRSAQEVLVSLLPHIQSGTIVLKDIPDLPPLILPPATPQPNREKPLIACVDDSPWMCQTLEQVVTRAGYRFLGITDALRAIPQLLARKPALVLLDLRMPVTNGYEICSQLRKLSAFRDIPIVILTGNDGIIDRARAKLVGATDFLNKSISQEQLIEVFQKYVSLAKEA